MNVQPTGSTRPNDPLQTDAAEGNVQGARPRSAPAIFDGSDVGGARHDDAVPSVHGALGTEGGNWRPARQPPELDSPLLHAALTRPDQPADPTSWIPLPRQRSGSPQPGTSTGAEGHRSGDRPVALSSVRARRVAARIVRQLEAGWDGRRIAAELHIPHATVRRVASAYLQRRVAAVDEQIRVELARLSSRAAAAPVAEPDVRGDAVRLLQAGVGRDDIARSLHLTERQVAETHGQLLDDEFAEIDMEAFRQMVGDETGFVSD
ncbi:helix-turn-helix domain-containing protein [Paraburkholderia bryophila]|uniref:helix-turn-helix domain-containing protein n=1 Tax=Paraburkholderia bryophila TaxID=420952 RepID=UPI00234B7746|nr:helix-turn-helix domain-containing protein [Paraburkholderia bryophila]WCM20980.1 helix-turn-helix domain-containing protein [Paraburkholderia bryophila]